MRVYINPGHDIVYDPGAVNMTTGLREADVAAAIGEKVRYYLEAAGCEVKLLQSDNLCWDTRYSDRNVAVCDDANGWPADVFVSIHCNAFNKQARGDGDTVLQRKFVRGNVGPLYPDSNCN